MTEKHLPIFGVGPYLIFSIALITLLTLALNYLKIIPTYTTNTIKPIFIIVGIILIINGIVFWLLAVIKSRIGKSVRSNDLITTGIYGYVRHPIYATFLYIFTGIIVVYGNILLFILPLIFWTLLTITMKKTEETWLIDLYGDDYINYSKKVNRFIPKVI